MKKRGHPYPYPGICQRTPLKDPKWLPTAISQAQFARVLRPVPMIQFVSPIKGEGVPRENSSDDSPNRAVCGPLLQVKMFGHQGPRKQIVDVSEKTSLNRPTNPPALIMDKDFPTLDTTRGVKLWTRLFGFNEA